MKKTNPSIKTKGQTQLTESQLQSILASNPVLFMPPADHAHDLYALSAYIQGFEHVMYQDIQQDHAMYDSLQRWPYLFGTALGTA
jgi:hypothetical protein